MKFVVAFLYVLLAGMQKSQGRTYHGTLSVASRHPHNPSLAHHTVQHEVLPTMERKSNVYGIGGSDVADMPRIVGGTEAEKHEFPWMVLLQVDMYGNATHWCAGSVINQWWVMTAGHCCLLLQSKHPDNIVAGDHNLKQEEGVEQHRKVESCIVHPQFTLEERTHDIALLKLTEPLELDGKTVAPITLPSQLVNSTGECVVPGWGQTAEGGRVSDSLMKVTVPIVTDEECQEMYDALPYDDLKIADSMICAGPIEGGKGTCRGDSGGSLLCQGPDEQYYSAGLVSWGVGCARPEIPTVYTEVSYYVDWINDVISSRVALPSLSNTVQFSSTGVGQ